MTNAVPSSTAALFTLVGVSWRRFRRGREFWVALVIALLPVLLALVVREADGVALVQRLVMGLLPPVFVAAAVGEEIEEKTSAYLWSRPLPRWSLLVGKLLALAPIAVALLVMGWSIAMFIATGNPPSTRSIAAFAVGGLVVSAMSAGIGMLVPKHGMALSIVYFIMIDFGVGSIPASFQSISISQQVQSLSGLAEPSAIVAPLFALAVMTGLWLTIALLKLRRLEA